MSDVQPPALEVRNLQTHFETPHGIARSVDGVSFTLPTSHVLAVVGESGSGKSVLSRTIMRLTPKVNTKSSGEVLLSGVDLMKLREKDMRSIWADRLSMVFQDPMTALNPVMPVGDQISELLLRHKLVPKAELKTAAIAALASVGIPDPVARAKQYPHELSGGMRQRVMIAIALAGNPELLIADEPTTALDVTIQAQIMTLLRQQQTQRRMSMILITHDLGIASAYADDLMVMYAGQVVERGPAAEVLRKPRSPYTEALRRSIPRLANPSHARLEVIPGRPPTMTDLPKGCRFAPRCRYAQDKCLTEVPGIEKETQTEHEYRCFYPVGTAANRGALALNLERGRTAAGLPVSQRLEKHAGRRSKEILL